MTNVIHSRKELETTLGFKITKEIEEQISLFGTPLERITDSEVEIEIFPNRPDLISLHGFARGFKAFLGKSKSLPQYKLHKPEKNFQVKISPSVKTIRPYTACAIAKNLSFNDAKIKEIIDLQEKLHTTLGRNRKKVAIGIYPLEKIKLPIKYEARSPGEIKFIPLEESQELTAQQILTKHPTGRDYANLLEGLDKYPIFTDAKGKILSMPPIINSDETGRITESTKEVFIECSGSNLEVLQKALNIIITTLADQGAEIYQMELHYGRDKVITPNLSPEKIKVNKENINKLLGLNLKESDLQKLLPKMGIEYKSSQAIVPAWRTDILHEVDIAEDVAIAYGYDNFTPEIPNISTTGAEDPKSIVKRKISEILIGLNLLEIKTYHLIKKDEAELYKLSDPIELLDSKTEYKILRPNLLIPALRILNENKDREYPQELFEIGTIFSKDNTRDTGISEQENLCVISAPANFTRIKQVLNYLLETLGISYELKEGSHDKLIDGRTASLSLTVKKSDTSGNYTQKPCGIGISKCPLQF
jgi:phenylalanyl-tRNA synthetase beta chain